MPLKYTVLRSQLAGFALQVQSFLPALPMMLQVYLPASADAAFLNAETIDYIEKFMARVVEARALKLEIDGQCFIEVEIE